MEGSPGAEAWTIWSPESWPAAMVAAVDGGDSGGALDRAREGGRRGVRAPRAHPDRAGVVGGG